MEYELKISKFMLPTVSFFCLDILEINCKGFAGMRRYLLTCIKILVVFLGIISYLKTVKNGRKSAPQVVMDLGNFLTY